MRELALFAGAGGGILGGHLLGWRTVCAVEWEPYAACVLAARQNDGLLPPFPIWSDVRTFEGRPWRGCVDVVSGGFPCQDISVAGKGAGITGSRSGMWSHMARIVGEVRPRFVFVENSPALLTRGLGVVLSDLAALGYDCRWTVLGAADVGAPHQRDRFWLVASDAVRQRHGFTSWDNAPVCDGNRNSAAGESRWHNVKHWTGGVCSSLADADSLRQPQPQGCQSDQRGWFGNSGEAVSHAEHIGAGWWQQFKSRSKEAGRSDAEWWRTEPDVGRVADGVTARVDRLKAIGNGQVPLCAAEAWRLLTEIEA